MAAAKKAKKSTTTASAPAAGHEPGREEIRIKYDPVMIALSKAEAAHCLAVKNQDGLFDDDKTAEWVEEFANDALSEVLDAAEAASVKAVSKAVSEKQAPATEAAR